MNSSVTVGRTHQDAGLSEPDDRSGPSGEVLLAATPPPIRKDGGASGSLSPSAPARRRRSRCVYCGYGHGPACAQHWDLLKLDPHYLA